MEEQALLEAAADETALLELGVALGQNHAFAMIAGRCSAAQAEGMRRLRDEKLYKRCCEKWEDFCARYLKLSRAEADRMIRLLEEFGPAYFELAQLTRVSADTYRAIQPAIRDGALHYEGQVIEISPENSRRVAAAVAKLRGSIAPRPPEASSLMQEIQALEREADLAIRIHKLDRCSQAVVAQFEKIAGDKSLAGRRGLLQKALLRTRDELMRVARTNGLS